MFRRHQTLFFGREGKYVTYLLAIGHVNEVAHQLVALAGNINSGPAHIRHGLWMQLCAFVATNASCISGLDFQSVICRASRRFPGEAGRLCCILADFYTRIGHFDRARDVYERGLREVPTIRDFSSVFGAYVKFEEAILLNHANWNYAVLGDCPVTAGYTSNERAVECSRFNEICASDEKVAPLDRLLERRPILLSSVALRRNRNDVHAWHERAGVLKNRGLTKAAISAYIDAVVTVEPSRALGVPCSLWTALADIYEERGNYTSAAQILKRALRYGHFKDKAGLGLIWRSWIGVILRQDRFREAIAVSRLAVTPVTGGAVAVVNQQAIRQQLHHSARLWAFCIEIEESLGTLESAQAAYERVLGLDIASPRIVLNYASMLKEHGLRDEALSVYERGISLFTFPHSTDIWRRYLRFFVAHFGCDKIERARDLFEQALHNCPQSCTKEFYLLYAALEHEHGE